MNRKAKYPSDKYIDYKIDDGDRDDDTRLYKSRLVKTRKAHKCCYCGSSIRKGDEALYGTVILWGDFCSFYHCLGCVEDQMDYEEGLIDSDEFFDRFNERYEENKGNGK